MGQGCVIRSLAPMAQKVCEPAAQGIKLCQADSDCSGSSTKCCTIYKTPICTAANDCPTACASDAACNTANGEICCTSVAVLETNLSAQGLCLNPTATPCPKACTQSSDCNGSATTPLCCGGFCPPPRPNSCQHSSACPGQTSSRAAPPLLPAAPQLFP